MSREGRECGESGRVRRGGRGFERGFGREAMGGWRCEVAFLAGTWWTVFGCGWNVGGGGGGVEDDEVG